MRQVILDTETTGISTKDGHRIIEIGAIVMRDRKITNETYHQYINPSRPIDAGAERVHGISSAFLADKPVFKDIVDEFIRFIDGAELIIHNAPFDVGFIDYEFSLLSPQQPQVHKRCTITDTLAMARKKHVGQRNNLDALCKRYQIDNSNRDLHGALIDAELLARVYLAMTGGQSSFFNDEQEPTDMEATQTAHYQRTSTSPLKIQPATSEEVQAHEAYLKQMEATGGCEWLRQDEAVTEE